MLMEMKDKQRNILLIASAVVLALALLLWQGLPAEHPYEHVAALLREAGYTVEAEQLYNAGSFPDQSIAGALSNVDLDEAVAASLSGGFPSRVEQVGDVALLLCALENQDVITIFLLNGEPELCFVQPLSGGALKVLGSEESP